MKKEIKEKSQKIDELFSQADLDRHKFELAQRKIEDNTTLINDLSSKITEKDLHIEEISRKLEQTESALIASQKNYAQL